MIVSLDLGKRPGKDPVNNQPPSPQAWINPKFNSKAMRIRRLAPHYANTREHAFKFQWNTKANLRGQQSFQGDLPNRRFLWNTKLMDSLTDDHGKSFQVFRNQSNFPGQMIHLLPELPEWSEWLMSIRINARQYSPSGSWLFWRWRQNEWAVFEPSL